MLLGLVNAACLNFRPDPTPLPDALAGERPAEVWSRRAGRGFTGPIVAVDSVVYGGGYDRQVYAVRTSDGEVLWKTRLGGPMSGGVLVTDSMVYAATARPDGELYAIRRRDGDMLWREPTGRTIVPLARAGDVIVTHTLERGVVGVNTRTGRIAWRTRARPGRAAPVAIDSVVIATAVDTVYRIDPANGAILLRRPLRSSVLGGWAVRDGRLIGGTTDSTVIALDPATLEPVWFRKVDAPVMATPVVRGDTIIAVSRLGTIYRLVGADSPVLEPVATLRWPVTAPPVLFGDLIVLGGADGTLRAYGPNGGERWRMAIWRPVDVAPVVADGALIAAGGNGDLYRLEN